MDGREGEASGQAAGGGAGIDPGEFEGDQRERQVLGTVDEAALCRIHEDAGDAGSSNASSSSCFGGRPLVGVARARGDQARNGAARHGPRRLHQHLQIEAIGEAPQNLADIVAGQM